MSSSRSDDRTAEAIVAEDPCKFPLLLRPALRFFFSQDGESDPSRQEPKLSSLDWSKPRALDPLSWAI
ncbi:hypothetical protein MRB53_005762 [Persea americana]|uniref:Uncharacterized protein n=1 Tax=Persea americana TaxID=3435 RepID=A0ACC2MEG8_PERAE|nr:hypothetical protein MRB53_005762 [Persea americana]